jgi:hypothetical protein
MNREASVPAAYATYVLMVHLLVSFGISLGNYFLSVGLLWTQWITPHTEPSPALLDI